MNNIEAKLYDLIGDLEREIYIDFSFIYHSMGLAFTEIFGRYRA